MTQPAEDLIKREQSFEINLILKQYNDYVEEAVNFGSQIFFWAGEGPIATSEVSKLLLRNFLDILDSLSILIKKGAGETSKILLRSAYEVMLYNNFIYEKHSVSRMHSFLVFEALSKLDDLQKLNSDSEKGKQIKTDFLKEGAISNFGTKHDQATVRADIKKLEYYLADPVFKDVIVEYKVQKLKRKKIYWYTLFEGAVNIESLARQLKRYTTYEVLYRKWSKSVHGHDIFNNKIRTNDNGDVFINSIREPIGLAQISKFACVFAINTFGHYVSVCFPDRLNEYKEWEDEFTQNIEADLNHEYINYVNPAEETKI